MRFCQVDGTPLVDDAPAFDPYATMVAPSGISAPVEEAPAAVEPEAPVASEPAVVSIEPIETAESEAATQIAEFPQVDAPIAEPEDVLDVPAVDPLKTMYVSEDEMRAALGSVDAADDPIMEIPEAAPEPPAFIAPEMPAPPPSPFAEPSMEPAIPSPFNTPAAVEPPVETPQFTAPEPVFEAPQFTEPEPPPFKEPEPVYAPAVMEPAASPPAEWTPPPVPDASWQNQEIGSNTPFQPPPVGVGEQNKTMPIVSLILGIVSLCCYVSPITGLAALVTGFLGMKNANAQPDLYGGKGLAIAGMVLGGIMFLIGLVYWVFLLFFGGMAMIMDAAR